MNYLISTHNTSRQHLAAPSRISWGTCAILCMLLAFLAAPATAGTNDFTENFGNKLTLNIGTSGTTVTITSAGTTYTATLSAGTWNGTDNANVSGNLSPILTVSSAGVSAYNVGGIFVTDTGGTGNTVAFGTSTGAYNSQLSVILADSGDSIQVNGTTTFAVNLGMIAQSTGTLSVAGVSLTATGTSSFEFTAAGAITVAAGASISAHVIDLLADTKTDHSGDDGAGTLTIVGNANISGVNIGLSGADIDISTTATVGDATTSNILITPSFPTAPISLGGANNQIPGAVNLTNPELARLTVSTSNGNIQFGNSFGIPNGQSGNIHCTAASIPMPAGTTITLSQDTSVGGSILLDSGGTALDVGSALLDLSVGMSGLVTNTDPVDSIVANGVTIDSGSGPIILWISSPPMNGDSFTIIHSTGGPISGNFANAPQGGMSRCSTWHSRITSWPIIRSTVDTTSH